MISLLFVWFSVLIIFALILLFSVIYSASDGNIFYGVLIIIIPIGAMFLYGNDIINASFIILVMMLDLLSLCFLVYRAQEKDDEKYRRAMEAMANRDVK